MNPLDTQLIAGDNPGAAAASVLLSGGVGTTNGNVVIYPRTDDSICSLLFRGSDTSYVGMRAGTSGATAVNFILPTNTGASGQMLTTNGSSEAQLSWQTPTIDNIDEIDITTPTVGQILQYDGTSWVNVPANPMERITAVGDGPDVSPTTVSQGTTFVSTTMNGTTIATGILEDGAYDGVIRRIVAANLAFDGTNYTEYTLDTSTNTTLIDAAGRNINDIDFVSNGNSITIIWDSVMSKWFIEGAGARVNL